ncbi:TPA: peptidyl-tRNA hydrolase [Candidatus Woesearchaeota archaeon]|nr:peptidyl-tRNA hydrolase [Candidatus Woesearchaeota archaeon]
MVQEGDSGYKQLILVRHDLGLPKGKLAAQAAHASVEATLRAEHRDVAAWRAEGMAKIVLKVTDEKELLRQVQRAKDDGIITAVITDAGHTVVAPGTRTCAAIGPADANRLDRLFGTLKLL